MSDQDFGSIAGEIAKSDPYDYTHRTRSLEQIRELRTVVEFAGAKSLGGFLDAAMLLTEYTPHLDEVSPDQIQQIVTRLVGMVESSFQEALTASEDGESSEGSQAKGDTIHLKPSQGGPSASPSAESGVEPQPEEPLTMDLGVRPTPADEAPASPDSLEAPLAPMPASAPPTTADIIEEVLLGEILVKLGTIDPEDVDKALQVQVKTGLRFGEALVQLGKALPSEVKKGLDIQAKIRESQKPEPQDDMTLGLPMPSPDPRQTADERFRGEPKPALPAGISLANEVNQVEELMLGDLLVQQGVITRDQLKMALNMQRASGLRIGETLVDLGAATWDQVKKTLRKQEIRRLQLKARYR